MARCPTQAIRRAAALENPLEGLRAVAAMRHHLDELEAMHVENALRVGRAWREIAEGLGVSKQAAHRKWAAVMRERVQAPASAPRGAEIVVTGRARLCVHYGRQEARAMGRDSVGTEHVLLGILREGDNAAAAALTAVEITLDRARQAVEEIQAEVDAGTGGSGRGGGAGGGSGGGGPTDPAGPVASMRLPPSPLCRAALEQSMREAVSVGSSQLAPEHLLRGLVHHATSGAAQVLRRLDCEAATVLGVLAGPRRTDDGTPSRDRHHGRDGRGADVVPAVTPRRTMA